MIAIKDMEMPQCCDDCDFVYYDSVFGRVCPATMRFVEDHIKPKDCPLIEVEEE